MRLRWGSAEPDTDLVNLPIAANSDAQRSFGQRNAVAIRAYDAFGVIDDDFITITAALQRQFEARPVLRDARIDLQERAFDAQPENVFDPRTLRCKMSLFDFTA